MNIRLTDQNYWENAWKNVKIPTIAKPNHDLLKTFANNLPKPSKRISLIEIGCAPGGWLAFFSNTFNYNVSGVEYANNAYEKTLANLAAQKIKANIIKDDFFNLTTSVKRNDIVFSAGFIEHFKNTRDVLFKIADLSQNYVVTIIPNLYGINGFICRQFRRSVYEKHNPISLRELSSLHENAGFKTIICQYSAGPHFILPIDKCNFARKYQYLSTLLNFPIRILNKLFEISLHHLFIYARCQLLCSQLIYIGQKRTPI